MRDTKGVKRRMVSAHRFVTGVKLKTATESTYSVAVFCAFKLFMVLWILEKMAILYAFYRLGLNKGVVQ